MARTITWTEAASLDLDEIAQFIGRDSKFYAAAFVREARGAARSLRRFAERGRVVPEVADPDIRELFVRSYRLVYKIDGPSKVYVLRLIHATRDFISVWQTP